MWRAMHAQRAREREQKCVYVWMKDGNAKIARNNQNVMMFDREIRNAADRNDTDTDNNNGTTFQ